MLVAETAARLGITLKRTRRYRPQTNGKVERFHKTLLDEWAYGRLYRSNAERSRAFARWLRSYNHRRPHTSLDGLTPMAILVNNLGGRHTWASDSANLVTHSLQMKISVSLAKS